MREKMLLDLFPEIEAASTSPRYRWFNVHVGRESCAAPALARQEQVIKREVIRNLWDVMPRSRPSCRHARVNYSNRALQHRSRRGCINPSGMISRGLRIRSPMSRRSGTDRRYARPGLLSGSRGMRRAVEVAPNPLRLAFSLDGQGPSER